MKLIGSRFLFVNVPWKLLFFIERIVLYLKGKGWGATTVAREFSAALSLLGKVEVNRCIDIGGNIGEYTDNIVKTVPGCNVVVFEPAGSNIELLRRKFLSNPNVKIEPYAVARESGEVMLYSNGNERGSGLASMTRRRLDHFGIDFDKAERVSTICFEDYWTVELKSQDIDICKIDIEGHELDALMGFGEAIKHISIIQFEFGGANIDTRTFFQDFWYFFQERDFELYRLGPLGLCPIYRYSEIDEVFSVTNYFARRNEGR